MDINRRNFVLGLIATGIAAGLPLPRGVRAAPIASLKHAQIQPLPPGKYQVRVTGIDTNGKEITETMEMIARDTCIGSKDFQMITRISCVNNNQSNIYGSFDFNYNQEGNK